MRSIHNAAACLAALFLLSGLPVMPASAQQHPCQPNIKIKIKVYLEGALSSLDVLKADAQDSGDMFQDCDECPLMTVVPAGSFQMGSPDNEMGRDRDEEPVHSVEIKKFAVGVCEVTFAEYDACVDDGKCRRPSDSGWGRGTRPVISINWNDASSYTAWLSEETGEEYRLLTEAEWEYAARAGTTTPWHFGSTITTSQANYNGTQTVTVGSYPANTFGLHDVHGNAEEWVEDCWHSNYDGAPADGRAWLRDNRGNCSRRVTRGGSWGSTPRALRSANRGNGDADAFLVSNSSGFRVARTLTLNP